MTWRTRLQSRGSAVQITESTTMRFFGRSVSTSASWTQGWCGSAIVRLRQSGRPQAGASGHSV